MSSETSSGLLPPVVTNSTNTGANAPAEAVEDKSGTKKKSTRILELDALRAIAALNLLLFHFTWVYAEKYGFNSEIGFLFPYGKYGVQLFFMLSGFVNAYMLLRRRQPGEFAVGRMIRILPSYWLMILVSIVLFCTCGMYNESVTLNATLANASVMPNLFGYHCWEPVTWTLQVEVLFYCFLAIILVTGLIDKPFKTLMVCVGFSLVGSLATGWVQANMAGSFLVGPMETLEAIFIMKIMPLFAMGMLLNEIVAKRGILWQNIAGIAISAVVFHMIDERNHNPAATLLLFGLLTASAFGKIPILRIKPFIFISGISYSLYLFHDNLGCLLIDRLEWLGCGPKLAVVLATAFAIAMAWAITVWFERPVTKWLQKKWATVKANHSARKTTESVSRGTRVHEPAS